jgi:soluble lytic murein transglycosylase-like protein
VDARLLHAVIAAESAYNPAALSAKGAVGIMQLLPGTARRYGVADAYDARQNIQGGARYLADLLRLFNNDTTLALAAYNAGEQAVLRHGGKVPPYRETVAYVPRVLGLYRHFASASL